jgi:hypothetical protein
LFGKKAKMFFMHPIKSRESIKSAYFDFNIRDFSLDSFDELEKILEVTKNAKDLKDVPGLWYMEDNQIKNNPMAPMFEDLDNDLPGQEWSLLDLNKYKAHNWHTFNNLEKRNKYASLQTSLGCPFKCTFCCINAPFQKNKIRCWSPKHIIKEIKLGNKIPVTLSIGIGRSDGSLIKSFQYAGAAIDIALGRGGDQVVLKNGEEIHFSYIFSLCSLFRIHDLFSIFDRIL